MGSRTGMAEIESVLAEHAVDAVERLTRADPFLGHAGGPEGVLGTSHDVPRVTRGERPTVPMEPGLVESGEEVGHEALTGPAAREQLGRREGSDVRIHGRTQIHENDSEVEDRSTARGAPPSGSTGGVETTRGTKPRPLLKMNMTFIFDAQVADRTRNGKHATHKIATERLQEPFSGREFLALAGTPPATG